MVDVKEEKRGGRREERMIERRDGGAGREKEKEKDKEKDWRVRYLMLCPVFNYLMQ